ncbi:thioredoxin-like protein [Punctularia strigosozonata HHB-11173 SS5]|uniref:thioredoxin-like protein n=1 Tax=Punctularia strigosozonata (strain HHB-11173) TaxID=741275 RepID=UPI0004416559|nr:thioredoxin-like protein [Punctularia strigosozonata HHB-11173 SS5]EIN11265.1 thioredoxin-like protein [Punctularia strigosozonata HHB-11173 SS5]
MSGKDITLWTHAFAPNGWKVICVLNLLGLSYESKYLDFRKQEQKSAEHVKLNPNGRIPTLVDHRNGDFIVWESNAILLYLVDTYDEGHKISVTGQDCFILNQWLFFQASGQGQYGQFGWFASLHPEKIPSAIERYQKEIIRILGVLESVLSKQEWLVGGKMTIADTSFIIWHQKMTALPMIKEPLAKEFENMKASIAASR